MNINTFIYQANALIFLWNKKGKFCLCHPYFLIFVHPPQREYPWRRRECLSTPQANIESTLTGNGRLIFADDMSLLWEIGGSIERGMVADWSVVGLTAGGVKPTAIVVPARESRAMWADSLWPRSIARFGFRRRSSSWRATIQHLNDSDAVRRNNDTVNKLRNAKRFETFPRTYRQIKKLVFALHLDNVTAFMFLYSVFYTCTYIFFSFCFVLVCLPVSRFMSLVLTQHVNCCNIK